MNPEKLLCLPVEAARFAGRVVLWATEKTVPMEPIGWPASIQYYETEKRIERQ